MKRHTLFIVENQTVPYDVRVWSEAKSVKEFGYEVSVICPVAKDATLRYENIDGIDIYRHPMPIEADSKLHFLFEYLNAFFWESFYCIKIFFKKRFHFIHAANPPDHIFLIALLYKIFGVRFIFDHHDICPENYLAKFDRKDIFYKLLLFMEKLTFKTANIVISTNQSYKNIAMTRGGKTAKATFVVRNGPDIKSIYKLPPNEKWKDGLDYLVAYIGVIGNQERIDVLLRIVEYIVYKKRIENIKFVIIGSGPHWNKMVQLAKEMKLNRYVNFTGFIPYKDVYEIFSTADVCVNPELRDSFTNKSTMIKIMEYMTFGKPIVQFETREGKITAGDSAIYIRNNDEVAFAEALIKLIGNSEQKIKMGTTGKKRVVEHLNWDKQKINLKNAYEYLEMSC